MNAYEQTDPRPRTEDVANAAYEEGYNAEATGYDGDPYFDEIEEHPEAYTAEEHALAAKIRAHDERMDRDEDYAQGVKDAKRDAAAHDHEQAWLSGYLHQL